MKIGGKIGGGGDGGGGTKDFADALAPFGLDPTSSTFWTDALTAHLGELVNEAEKIDKELGYIE